MLHLHSILKRARATLASGALLLIANTAAAETPAAKDKHAASTPTKADGSSNDSGGDSNQAQATPSDAQVGVACLTAFEAAEAVRNKRISKALDLQSASATAVDARKKAEQLRGQVKLNPQAVRWQSCTSVVTDVCTEAARGQIEDSDEVLKHVPACIKYRAASTTAGATDIGSEVLRSVAQVVVTKAQAAGWQLLLDRLQDAAQCSSKDTKFPSTCKVLKTLNIKDVVSSPEILVDAVVNDLLGDIRDPVLRQVIEEGAPVVGVALLDATQRWAQSGNKSFALAMRQAVLDYALSKASNTCDPLATIPEKYGYVLGMCLAQASPQNLVQCDAATLITDCSSDPAVTSELKRLWDLSTTAFAQGGAPIDYVNLVFALGRDQLDVTEKAKNDPVWTTRADAYFAGVKDLSSGLAEKDWVTATAGGVELFTQLAADTANTGTCDTSDKNATLAKSCVTAHSFANGANLFWVLAAVGNYALTFDKISNPDPTAAAAAREKIITELVDRMVNRTDRQSGAVVSLGGTLGIFLGPRFANTDKLHADVAFPVQLSLGVGLQTYSSSTGGLHLMFSAVDLGQYVNLNDSGALQVASPDLKSALAPGVDIGGWFALRETPFHVALHGSIAPFNRADGKPTYQVGILTGIYVPLLDFN